MVSFAKERVCGAKAMFQLLIILSCYSETFQLMRQPPSDHGPLAERSLTLPKTSLTLIGIVAPRVELCISTTALLSMKRF